MILYSLIGPSHGQTMFANDFSLARVRERA